MSRNIFTLFLAAALSLLAARPAFAAGQEPVKEADPPQAPTALMPGDYSELSWTDAFARAHAQFSAQYAFGAWKGIDWKRLESEYAPRIAFARETGDIESYHIAMREYLREIPDANVVATIDDAALKEWYAGADFGIALADSSDEGVIAVAAEGMEPGARILAWNGVRIEAALAGADTRWFPGAQNAAALRLQRLQALVRGPEGAKARVLYRNPGATETGVAEFTAASGAGVRPAGAGGSFPFSRQGSPEKAVDWKQLDSGTGYIAVSALSDPGRPGAYPYAIRDEFAAALYSFVRAGVTRLVLDLRGNHGGSDQLAADIAGFFTEEPGFYGTFERLDGRSARYEPFWRDEERGEAWLLPTAVTAKPQKPRFIGRLAVLIDAGTRGAGEALAQVLGRLPDSALAGPGPTGGSFGLMGNSIAMPGGVSFSYPIGRSLGRDGSIQLESGRAGPGGVSPTILVPSSRSAILLRSGGRDLDLEYALSWLHAGTRDKRQNAAEPEKGEFEAMGWTQAFFAANSLLSRQYAYGEWKKIPWDRLADAYGPRVRAAEASGDRDAWRIAVREYLKEFRDAQVRISGDDDLRARFAGGSFGLGLAALDDGRVVAAAIAPGGSAAAAGMSPGSEILTWNGLPIRDAVAAADTRWFSDEGTAAAIRLRRVQALTRGPTGSVAVATYLSPGSPAGSIPLPAFLAAKEDGFADLALFDPARRRSDEETRTYVERRVLEDGIGYLRILADTDIDDPSGVPRRTSDLVEQAIGEFNGAGLKRLVVDLRADRGGSDRAALEIAGYFHDSPRYFGTLLSWGADGASTVAAKAEALIPASQRFTGRIAILAGPATIGSAENLAMALKWLPNARVIGFEGTNGSPGSLRMKVSMPEGLAFEYPRGAYADHRGRVYGAADSSLRGGVQPDIRVPASFANVMAFAGGVDVELKIAVEWLKK